MRPNCPSNNCNLDKKPGPQTTQIVRKGVFFRKSDSRKIARFYCKSCQKTFSHSTGKSSAYQKQRRITHLLKQLLNSGVSQRRAARILNVNPKTVIRRFRYIAKEERSRHEKWLKKEYQNQALNIIQFDDLETAEHSKCKPLSVALAVDPKTRKILSFQVNQMPARGHLAKIAFIKYGFRRDERPIGWDALLKNLVPLIKPDAIFHSDENPHYPKFVKKYYPLATHSTVLGGRGSIAGQGELKKLKYDTLFSLNHTCAMLRANLNRLFRRTWCITKNGKG